MPKSITKLINLETKILSNKFKRLRGFYLVFIGSKDFLVHLSKIPIFFKIWLCDSKDINIAKYQINYLPAKPDRLPLLNGSVDAVYMPHFFDANFRNDLDISDILREIYVILDNKGYLIITGKGRSKATAMYSLTNLGFEIVASESFCYLQADNNNKIIKFVFKICNYFGFGGGYVILAKKQTLALIKNISLTLKKQRINTHRVTHLADS